jgi:hypothetical protein
MTGTLTKDWLPVTTPTALVMAKSKIKIAKPVIVKDDMKLVFDLVLLISPHFKFSSVLVSNAERTWRNRKRSVRDCLTMANSNLDER